jgi:tetratricopeptide (TPR) repeat protein
MEETFLSRFDGLDVQVRKVLQTCAVLGLTFSFADVVQVHPEMEEADIEYAMCSAVDEMVLVEQNDEDEERTLISAASNGDFDDSISNFLAASRASTSGKTHDERFFQFSHAMWRKSVLTTMLKERKIEIHRLIAEAMETDKVLILEESDITRLLTLFDHWKSCGDFSKSAPLALVVGARLEEWDLSAQSLELYEDALSMAFDSVETHEDMEAINDEWVQVSARPIVLDLILRLHIRIGLCHQRLGDESESIATFEDAFNIMNTSSKFPGISRSLMMPIISSLCVLKLERDVQDSEGKEEQEQLLQQFLCEATINGNPVHIGRVFALQAMYHAKTGSLDRALDDVHLLQKKYDIQENSFDMITEYGRDFALECFSESVQWIYLLEKHDAASDRADLIMDQYLTLIDPIDGESMMAILLPILNVLKLLNRATDADWLLKRHIINPAHDQAFHCDFWVPLFNPLAYLLEVVVMEESEDFDEQVLQEMELWVLEEENSKFDFDLEYKAHTLMGELCWRLANFKEENNPTRGPLIDKARDFLTPVAQYPHGEVFLRNTAQALLEVL